MHAVVAVLVVTFLGIGAPAPHTETMLLPDAAACAKIKAATLAVIEKDPKVAGVQFACVPVDLQPALKS